MKTEATALVLVAALAAMSPVIADEWYDGGDLNDKDNVAWQEAGSDNRLASAANTVAALWNGEYLVPRIQTNITSMDAMKPYAIELMTCIDTATEKGFDGVRFQYSDLAMGCVALMEWTKL